MGQGHSFYFIEQYLYIEAVVSSFLGVRHLASLGFNCCCIEALAALNFSLRVL